MQIDVQLAQSGVFFAGEKFSCAIAFRHPLSLPPNSAATPIRTPAASSPSSPRHSSTSSPNHSHQQQSQPSTSTTAVENADSAIGSRTTIKRNASFSSSIASLLSPLAAAKSPLVNDNHPTAAATTGATSPFKTPVGAATSTNFATSSHSNVDPTSPVSLFGASVQLYGSCIVDKNIEDIEKNIKPIELPLTRLKLGEKSKIELTQSYNSGEIVLPIYSSPSIVLFKNIKLNVGETCTYVFESVLPKMLPPSHRGKYVKFVYKLILTIQEKENVEAYNIKVPIRIFNFFNEDGISYGCDLMKLPEVDNDNGVVYCEEERSQLMKLKALHLTHSQSSTATIDIALKGFRMSEFWGEVVNFKQLCEATEPFQHSTLLDLPSIDDMLPEWDPFLSLSNINMHCQASAISKYFDIAKNGAIIAQLCLLKNIVRVGESIHVLLDFTHSKFRVFQVSANLDQCEVIDSTQKKLPPSSFRKSVAEHHEYCHDSLQTDFVLQIPTNATPEFQTTFVSVVWQVRLEFIIGVRNKSYNLFEKAGSSVPLDRGTISHLANEVGVDVFQCNVPITVYPCNPESAKVNHKHTVSIAPSR